MSAMVTAAVGDDRQEFTRIVSRPSGAKSDLGGGSHPEFNAKSPARSSAAVLNSYCLDSKAAASLAAIRPSSVGTTQTSTALPPA